MRAADGSVKAPRDGRAPVAAAAPRAVLVGLIGAGIQASRTPALHEREGAAHGVPYIYKIIDLDALGLTADALPELLDAARRFGFAGLNVTHPCKQSVIALLDDLALDARALGAVQLGLSGGEPLAREDLAFALSVVLLGLLMMVTRRNAVSQVVGFMSLENGLVLAATGAKGMPLVVEISVAFSVLIAFIVIGIFLFRIRERFDSVDIQAMDRFRGERR